MLHFVGKCPECNESISYDDEEEHYHWRCFCFLGDAAKQVLRDLGEEIPDD